MKKYIWVLIAVTDTILVDQISKFIATQNLGKSIPVIGEFLKFTLYHNHGIAFSLNVPREVTIALTILLIIGGFFLAQKELDFNKKTVQYLVGIIIGGAIGNLIDRIVLGSVTDFIAILNYPVFNIADIAVSVGIVSVIVFYKRLSRSNTPTNFPVRS
jgi:signal peptidase II